jgi:hypothetical protein
MQKGTIQITSGDYTATLAHSFNSLLCLLKKKAFPFLYLTREWE